MGCNNSDTELQQQQASKEQLVQSPGIAAKPAFLSSRMTLADLLNADLPEPNSAVDGLIPAGLIYLSGRPKVGKSILALQLAAAKAAGNVFLGRSLRSGKVLYVDLENGVFRMQKRIQELGLPETATVTFQFEWTLLKLGGLQRLTKEVEEQKWDLVIIDTFSRALGRADQMDIQEMSTIAGELQLLALKNSMSIIVIDHQRKAGRDHTPDPVDDVLARPERRPLPTPFLDCTGRKALIRGASATS